MIRSLWLEDAIKDPRLSGALARLKLNKGSFDIWIACVNNKTLRHKKIRVFFHEGPNGGVSGILMANKVGRRTRWGVREPRVFVGVYVDRKRRRQRVGSDLVHAARTHFPAARFMTDSWSDISQSFWGKMTSALGGPRDC